jgi:two-component system, chemotaxis family, chemotaxis protein CheY
MATTLVCVADDDQLVQFTFKKLISYSTWPCEVIPLYDGEQLCKYLLKNASKKDALPDVILLDLNMPFMNGWEFFESYKQIKPSLKKVPVIYVITSTTTEQELANAKSNPNVKSCILKPVTKDKIEALFAAA